MRQKGKGFSAFMCKLDGREPVVKSTPRMFSVEDVEEIREHHLLDAIDGDVDCLWRAFLWRTTPQGHDYWQERANGYVDLSEDDLDYLQELLEMVS